LKASKLTKTLIFVRSGFVDLPNTDGTLRYTGTNSDYWSSRSYLTPIFAYYFDNNPDGVYSSGGPNNRWYAFPLRCLSTVLGM